MPIQPTAVPQQLVAVCAMLLVGLVPQGARAGLGGAETTVAEDAQQLNGTVKSTQRTQYRVHEIQLASGTVLREFANAGGTVFAVAWNGPRIPDLRAALGRYFDAYVSAAQGRHLGRTHMEIRQNDWVMQATGHMRAFQGRAYLPQSVPSGTSLDEIR
jgi:hypothetical protein